MAFLCIHFDDRSEHKWFCSEVGGSSQKAPDHGTDWTEIPDNNFFSYGVC